MHEISNADFEIDRMPVPPDSSRQRGLNVWWTYFTKQFTMLPHSSGSSLAVDNRFIYSSLLYPCSYVHKKMILSISHGDDQSELSSSFVYWFTLFLLINTIPPSISKSLIWPFTTDIQVYASLKWHTNITVW
jgi:hypothetical protein